MITSLVLLLGLQALWLNNAYDRAWFDFRREAGSLFRTAVLAVRDSALFKHIETMPADSTSQPTFVFSTRVDSTIIRRRGTTEKLELKHRSPTQIQVFVASRTSSDSIRSVLQPYASRLAEGKEGISKFVLRMNTDSLNLDSIRSQFDRLTQNTRYALPYKVSVVRGLPPMPLRDEIAPRFDPMADVLEPGSQRKEERASEMKSEWVRVDPVTRYAASFSGFRPALLRDIFPQILFSGFLTVITSLSFIFMYRSIRSQERLMKVKNDLISNITHELKTPIATVSVALEAIRNFGGKDNPKTTEEYLDIARYELNRLTQLTDKVLTTSLFDEHGMRLEFHEMDLREIAAQATASLKLMSEKHNTPIAMTVNGSDFIMKGNAFHLSHVIHNLLDNAMKYAAGSGTIQVDLTDLGSALQCTVTDHGPGIPAEYTDKVFDKFFRVPTGDIHNTKGHGLGLNYVRTIVKLHHGDVVVRSKPGDTAFTVTLPRNP